MDDDSIEKAIVKSGAKLFVFDPIQAFIGDTAFVEIKANNGEPIKNGLIYGTVKGLKIDRETQKPIKGVLFGLFRADETEFTAEKAILTAQSDENSIFTFENIPLQTFSR